MQHITVKVKNLDQKYFSQYGKVLGPQDGVPSSSNELFDIWVGVDEIISRVGVPKLSWFNVKPKRDFICNKIERHLESSGNYHSYAWTVYNDSWFVKKQ